MANQLYPLGKEGFITKQIDMSADNIKAILTRDAYNAADQFLSDISDVVATSVNLTSKTVALGVFDSADITYPTVGAAAITNYLVMYQDTGAAGTSRLIAHIDTATGLPVTPDGTNITVEVNASGWFAL